LLRQLRLQDAEALVPKRRISRQRVPQMALKPSGPGHSVRQ
jgi:hypothetical protein